MVQRQRRADQNKAFYLFRHLFIQINWNQTAYRMPTDENMRSIHALAFSCIVQHRPQIRQLSCHRYILGGSFAFSVPVVVKPDAGDPAFCKLSGYFHQHAFIAVSGKSMPKNQAWKLSCVIRRDQLAANTIGIACNLKWNYHLSLPLLFFRQLYWFRFVPDMNNLTCPVENLCHYLTFPIKLL